MRTVEAVARELLQRVENLVGHVLLDPMQRRRALAEFDALLGHLVLVLFSHRAPQQIGAAERVAREDLRGLHDLLLVDEHAIGLLRHLIEQRVRRLHLGLALLPLDVVRDQVHRPRPVERQDRVDVLDVRDVELPAHPDHAPGFELEDRDGLAAIQHVKGRLVIDRDLVDVESGFLWPDERDGVGDDGQRFQPEEIHLQHPEIAERTHRVLAHDRAVARAGQRDVFGEIAVADDHARRMHADVPRQPFERRGVFPHLLRRALLLDRFFQLGIFVDRSRRVLDRAGLFVLLVETGERDPQLVRDHLRDAIRVAIRPAQHAPHIAHHRLRAHRAKGRNLRHRAVAVFVAHVVDDLGAAVHAKVHVDVGRRHAFGVEEALEEQLVMDRVDVRDPHRVGHHRPRRRAAARSHGDAVLPRPIDEIPHDQEIVHEALRLQQCQLPLQPLADHRVLRRPRAIALAQTGVHDLPQVAILRQPRGRRVVGILRHAEFDLHIAPLRDRQRVGHRLGVLAEQRRHFRRRFEIQLRRVFHPPLIGHVRARADADHHVVRLVVRAFQEMHVIRRHQLQAQLLPDPRQRRAAFEFRLDPVVVHFEEKILRPEDVAILPRETHRLRIIVRQERRVDLAFQTPAQPDQPRRVLRQQLLVDARLVIHPVEMRLRDQLHEIRVARVVLGQQREMIRRVPPVARPAIQMRTRRHIHLAPDDRLHPRFLAFLKKLNRPEEIAVIRHRHRRHPQRLRLFHQLRDAHRPIEQRILGVQMQVNERIRRHAPKFANRRPRGKRARFGWAVYPWSGDWHHG